MASNPNQIQPNLDTLDSKDKKDKKDIKKENDDFLIDTKIEIDNKSLYEAFAKVRKETYQSLAVQGTLIEELPHKWDSSHTVYNEIMTYVKVVKIPRPHNRFMLATMIVSENNFNNNDEVEFCMEYPACEDSIISFNDFFQACCLYLKFNHLDKCSQLGDPELMHTRIFECDLENSISNINEWRNPQNSKLGITLCTANCFRNIPKNFPGYSSQWLVPIRILNAHERDELINNTSSRVIENIMRSWLTSYSFHMSRFSTAEQVRQRLIHDMLEHVLLQIETRIKHPQRATTLSFQCAKLLDETIIEAPMTDTYPQVAQEIFPQLKKDLNFVISHCFRLAMLCGVYLQSVYQTKMPQGILEIIYQFLEPKPILMPQFRRGCKLGLFLDDIERSKLLEKDDFGFGSLDLWQEKCQHQNQSPTNTLLFRKAFASIKANILQEENFDRRIFRNIMLEQFKRGIQTNINSASQNNQNSQSIQNINAHSNISKKSTAVYKF